VSFVAPQGLEAADEAEIGGVGESDQTLVAAPAGLAQALEVILVHEGVASGQFLDVDARLPTPNTRRPCVSTPP
jgi:hypothetical protein